MKQPRADKRSFMLKRLYDYAASLPCALAWGNPRASCRGRPVELHHVRGGVSAKTGQGLGRRKGHAIAIVVPLCAEHHRNGADSVHAHGERGFELIHGKPDGFLLSVAASVLAAFVSGEGV